MSSSLNQKVLDLDKLLRKNEWYRGVAVSGEDGNESFEVMIIFPPKEAYEIIPSSYEGININIVELKEEFRLLTRKLDEDDVA